jgi:hypothetical protein
MEALIAACLEKKPDRRPRSILEFLARLDAADTQWRTLVGQQATVVPGGGLDR